MNGYIGLVLLFLTLDYIAVALMLWRSVTKSDRSGLLISMLHVLDLAPILVASVPGYYRYSTYVSTGVVAVHFAAMILFCSRQGTVTFLWLGCAAIAMLCVHAVLLASTP